MKLNILWPFGYQGAGVLLVYQNKVFVGHRAFNPFKGFISIPGGKREFKDRTIFKCAIRELREEVGYLAKFKNTYEYLGKSQLRFPFFSFTTLIIRVPKDLYDKTRKLKKIYSSELIGLKWVPIEQLPAKVHPGLKNSIQQYINILLRESYENPKYKKVIF